MKVGHKSKTLETKIKNLKIIPIDAILVTADVVDLYQSIPNESGLKAIKETLDKGKRKPLQRICYKCLNLF